MGFMQLSDVCAINMGQSPDSSSYNDVGNGLPFFQGNADFGDKYPITRVWCSEPTKIAHAEDILISVRAPIGAMNYAKDTCCIGRGLAAITPDKARVSPEFIFWLLKGKNAELNSKGTGSTFKAISRKVLEEVSVPDISLAQQTAYATHLETVYGIIQTRQRELRTLDTLIKARFVEMFGHCDYPYTELIELILDGAGLSYGIVQPGDDGTGDMGVLRPVDLSDGRITTATIKYIDRSIGEGFKKTELTGEELLITVRGTTGITALTDTRFSGMNVTRGIAVIRYDRDKINPIYLNAYLNSEESQRYIREHTRGATLQQINLSDLRVQQILVPPRALQDKYSAFVQQVDKSKVVEVYSAKNMRNSV